MSKLKKIVALFALTGASVNADSLIQTFGSEANQFHIEFVEVGNPGNVADVNGYPGSVGSVGQLFYIGRYEVSRQQIEKANSAGSLGITLADLTAYGGNGPNRPATGLSWYEAANFVNWMNTSQGFAPAYRFSGNWVSWNNPGGFEMWDSTAPGYQSNNPLRNSMAKYFLPDRDEWYKAAYFDPNKEGGAGYWKYPTQSDSEPAEINGGTDPGTAVYGGQSGPSDTTNAGGASAYGTIGQGGNALEWTESLPTEPYAYPGDFRVLRGGDWTSGGSSLSSLNRSDVFVSGEGENFGFRVAMVPEPSSLSLLLAGGAVFAAVRRRKLD